MTCRLNSLFTLLLVAIGLCAEAQTVACSGEALSLPSEANASQFLWQVQENVAWNTVTNGGGYSGATTATLTINPVGLGLDGNAYRCLIPSVMTQQVDSVVFETTLAVVESLNPTSIEFAPNSGPDDHCNGNNSIGLNQTSPATGSDGVVTTSWQVFSGGAWQTLDGEDEAALDLVDLTETTVVRQRSVDSGTCPGPVYSNELTINVLDALTPPTLGIDNGDDAICHQTSPGPLSMVTPPSGGSNAWSYQWQSFNSGSWTNLSSEVGTSYTPAALSQDQSYRLVATDAQCGASTSEAIDIVVFAPLSAPMVISTPQTAPLCDMNDGATIALEAAPLGGGDQFAYQWTSFGNNMLGATDTELTVAFLDSTTTFQLVATSVEGCGQVFSNDLTVEVYDPLTLGTVSEDQTICYNTIPEPLTCEGAFGASGGYDFQWEADFGTGWLPMPGGTSTTLNLQAQNADLSFRLRASDLLGCGTNVSDVIQVNVLDPWGAGDISSSTTQLCFQDNFSVTADGPFGADGDFTNTWYVSLEGGSFQAVDSLTALSWEVNLAEQDQSAFLLTTSNFGCGTLSTDTVHVDVLDPIEEPAIAFPGYNGVNLCFGDLAPLVDALSLATGADGDWTYVWQQSGTNEVWADVQNDPNPYDAGALFDTALVRMLGISTFGCGTFESNALVIPVWDEVISGSINYAPEATLCYGTEAAELVAENATGGGQEFDVQWFSTSLGSTSPIPFAQSLSLTPGVLFDTTSYYIEYTNLNGCGVVTSNSIQFSVLPDLQVGFVDGWNGQTLCYNETLTLGLQSVQDYPWLSHQWYQFDSTGAIATMAGFDELTASNYPVSQPSTFFVETTSNFGCGTVESASLFVDVWDELLAASIDFASGFDGLTLCYLDSSPSFTTINPATGGGGPLVYEWETQLGLDSPYMPTGSSVLELFNPGELADTIRVRLRVVDEYGCGSLVSNAEQVNVFAELLMDTQPEDTPTCFEGTPLNFTSTATGGGDDYALQWYFSETDTSFDPAMGQASNTLENLALVNDTWFYLSIVSNYGCGSLISDTALAYVLEPLIPGDIAFAFNPICAEDFALLSSTSPSGGFDDFTYTWFQSDGMDWLEFAENNSGFTSPMLFENTTFFATYTDDCGTVYSDSIEVTVNPLPLINPIVGENEPCFGSVNQSYRIPNWNYTWTYEWGLDESLGQITSGETVDEILVDWFDTPGETSISVVVTNPTTACNDEFYFEVTVSDVMAPPPSIVVKKPGINILVSADSTSCAQHQWGRKNIETGQVTYFPALNEQYAYFQDLDTLQFHYFVDVVYDCGDGASCPTRNFYNHSPYVGVEEASAFQSKVFPNPVQDRFSFESNQQVTRVLLHNSAGQIVEDWQGIGSTFNALDVGHLPHGMYLVEFVSHRRHRSFQRIVVQ